MTTSKKYNKILPIILVVILIVFCAAGIGFYIYASEVRFDYCDASVYLDSADLDQLLESGCEMVYPFFGNSASLSEGQIYSYPFGIGSDKAPVYAAVNSPIHAWAEQITTKYQNCVKVGYEVLNEGDTLTVQMRGSAYPEGIDGESTAIEKDFVFDIKNASPKNLPKLISE